MASGIGDPEISAMIRHHHERLDGRGYPDGLSGEDIPLGARIIAVADTFDAITSNRTYRRASHHKRALDVLAAEAGKQLDGDAVAAFRGYYRGHRTVALSALVASAPQRLLTWLGGASPVIGAGAAGATALLIGVGSPQPAVYSPTRLDPPPAITPPPPRRSARARVARRRAQPHGRDREPAPGGAARARRRAPRAGARTPGGSQRPAAGGGRPRPRTPASGGAAGGGADEPAADGSQPGNEGPKVPDVKAPPVKVPPVHVPAVEVPVGQGPASVEVPAIKLPGVNRRPGSRRRRSTRPPIKTPPINVPGVDLPGLP